LNAPRTFVFRLGREVANAISWSVTYKALFAPQPIPNSLDDPEAGDGSGGGVC